MTLVENLQFQLHVLQVTEEPQKILRTLRTTLPICI